MRKIYKNNIKYMHLLYRKRVMQMCAFTREINNLHVNYMIYLKNKLFEELKREYLKEIKKLISN